MLQEGQPRDRSRNQAIKLTHGLKGVLRSLGHPEGKDQGQDVHACKEEENLPVRELDDHDRGGSRDGEVVEPLRGGGGSQTV